MRIYNPNPKHEGPVIRGGKDAAPMDLTLNEAFLLLNHTTDCRQVPGKRQYIGIKENKIYIFQDDNAGGYHGYRISGNEVVRNFTALASWVAMKLGVNIKRLSRMSL
jgi:filamentous hemagglutinin